MTNDKNMNIHRVTNELPIPQIMGDSPGNVMGNVFDQSPYGYSRL